MKSVPILYGLHFNLFSFCPLSVYQIASSLAGLYPKGKSLLKLRIIWTITIANIYWHVLRSVKWKSLSRVCLQPHGLYSPWNSPGQNTRVGSLSLLQGIFPVQFSSVAQSCPTLCDPMDYNIVHGILQARVLEWIAIPFSRGSSQPRDRT